MSKKKVLLFSILVLMAIGYYGIDNYRKSTAYKISESVSDGDWKINYSINKNKKENSIIDLDFEYLGSNTDLDISSIDVVFQKPIDWDVTMVQTGIDVKDIELLPAYKLGQEPLTNTKRMTENKLKEVLSNSYCEIEVVDTDGQLKKQKIFF